MNTVETEEASIGNGLTDAAGERTRSYVDRGVHALKTVSGKARQIGQHADGYVRNNPWWAIGAAAGVGICIGLLLRGRRGS
jgi:ElaB/YqjD/DUF883 family membrane-anchored ribosome-binding protein